LFLFAWIFSITQVMLFFAPVRGVLQSVVAVWYGQGLWSLLLAPIALGAAYYLVPKITGRPLPSYTFAPHAFWTLILLGAWTGGRHLVGGPVPAWLGGSAIVAGVLMLFHYTIVFLNLRGAFSGGGTTLKFVGFGVLAYLLQGLAESFFSFYRFARVVQFTHFEQAQSQLAVLGAFSLIIFGALYFILPRLVGKAWPSVGLIRFHFLASLLGVILIVVGLAAAGVVQGTALNDASIGFADIATRTRPWLLLALVGQGVFLLGSLAFAAHVGCLLRSACCSKTEENPFKTPGQMEASVS
jgi:cytochrome c oxidase cbb3-type subunit 1